MSRKARRTPAEGHPRQRGHPAPVVIRTLLLGTMLVLLSACASAGAVGGAAQGGASGSAGSGGSAGAAGTARAVPSASPSGSAASPAASSASGCAPAPATITIRTGQQPPPVCMHVGDTLTIIAPPSPTQPWQPITIVGASALACTSQQHEQGALTAVCHALSPGTAAVSTMTAPFAGDPHGPPQLMWTLTIHVQAAA